MQQPITITLNLTLKLKLGKQITAEITNSENEEEVLRKKLALLLSTSFKDVILNGVSPLSLPNAQANGLGYIKLFGKAETLNLINKNTMTPNCYINTNGDIVPNRPTLDITDYIEVTAGKLYHYTATTYGTSPCLAYYDSNKELLGTILMANVKDYTPTVGTVYVRLSIYKTTLDVASFSEDVSPTETISMNGQTATAQNLLSCGDYVDEQNITTGEVVRKVEYRIIDGTENWLSYSATSATGYMYRLDNTHADPTTFDVISTHFRSTTRAVANMVIGEARFIGQSIYVCAEQDTVENFKTWLANQSTNGTPVVFVYAKATPTTETVTPQTNIQTVAGNNTLTITQAAVDMLKMEVKYKAKG